MDFQKCIDLSKNFMPKDFVAKHEQVLQQSLKDPLASFTATLEGTEMVMRLKPSSEISQGIGIGISIGLKMAYLAYKDPERFAELCSLDAEISKKNENGG